MRSSSQGYGKYRGRPDVRPGLYSSDQVIHILERVMNRGNTTETESFVAHEVRAIWPKFQESLQNVVQAKGLNAGSSAFRVSIERKAGML
jgi:hypothetical protein